MIRVVTVLCLLVASVARGDDGWRDRVSVILSERLRGEFVDWFRPRPGTTAPGAERYDFFASQLRAGLSVVLPHAQLTLVAQDTRLANLPADASLLPLAGNLGPGANQVIRAVVTVARGTPSSAVKDCLVTSTSIGDNLKSDAVKARVTVN